MTDNVTLPPVVTERDQQERIDKRLAAQMTARDAQREEVARLASRHVATLREKRHVHVRYWRRGHVPVVSVIDRQSASFGGGWEIGYTWSRPYAHHMNGLVYDCILGRGVGRVQAMERAVALVERQERRALLRAQR